MTKPRLENPAATYFGSAAERLGMEYTPKDPYDSVAEDANKEAKIRGTRFIVQKKFIQNGSVFASAIRIKK